MSKTDVPKVNASEGATTDRSYPRRLIGAVRTYAQGAYHGENSGILILVVLLTIGAFAVALRDTNYLSASNMLSVGRQTAAITVMSVATVFVIASRELDLSFAGVIPVAGYIAAMLLPTYGLVIAVLGALGFGALVGLINGSISVFFQIPSFVVTLGMLGFLDGLKLRITGAASIGVYDSGFIWAFGRGELFGFPMLIVWSLAAVVVGHIVLNWTATGRGLLATGANPEAALYSGIRTKRIKIGALVASGMGGAFAGLLYVGQFAAATYTIGGSDLLTVIAAVIIGGTALSGGKGSIVGAAVGALLIGVLNNGLVIIGLANPEQLMVRGAIIIAAVIFSARNVKASRKADDEVAEPM